MWRRNVEAKNKIMPSPPPTLSKLDWAGTAGGGGNAPPPSFGSCVRARREREQTKDIHKRGSVRTVLHNPDAAGAECTWQGGDVPDTESETYIYSICCIVLYTCNNRAGTAYCTVGAWVCTVITVCAVPPHLHTHKCTYTCRHGHGEAWTLGIDCGSDLGWMPM